MADVTPEPIMRIAMGFMAAKHLFVAEAIGIFEKLAEGAATAEDLAGRCDVPVRTLRISADAMVSLGLLERDGEYFSNGSVAANFLAGNPGPDLRPMLRFWDRISYPAWVRLENAVRSGEGQAYFDRFSEEEQRIFSTGVEAFTAAAAAALASAYDFEGHRSLLDVAGGTGSFLIAILRRHTDLRGTLFGPCARATRPAPGSNSRCAARSRGTGRYSPRTGVVGVAGRGTERDRTALAPTTGATVPFPANSA